MPDLQATPLQSIENMSDKGEEEEEEEEDIDYDIEWRVLLGKEPIICDIINRSDFRFFKLCTQAKEKAQEYTNKLKKDAEALNCKGQIAAKREKPFEIMIEWSEDIAKIDKKYTQLKRASKSDIRVYMTYSFQSVIRIDEDESSSSDEDEMAPTQRTASQARASVSNKKDKKDKKDKKKKQRSTVTTLLQAEEPANETRDIVSGSHAIEIAKNNRCSANDCPNKGYACIAYGSHAHIRLNSHILKQWDTAIGKGQATVMEPPRHLIGKLFEGIANRKNSKQANHEERSDIKGLVININNGGASASTQSAEGPLRSSPVELAGDVDQALIDYIEEWCGRRPLVARQFRDTLKKLQDETLGFNDLDIIEEKGLWPQFATAGIAAALMKDRKRFQRDQDALMLAKQTEQSRISIIISDEDIDIEDSML
jgi:hypothetical protein